MDRDECLCRSHGRLLIEVESEIVNQIQVSLVEEHGYRDCYTIYLRQNKGHLRVDHIADGKLLLSSDIDDFAYYYPNREILFTKQNEIIKVTIIDRRKKDELQQ